MRSKGAPDKDLDLQGNISRDPPTIRRRVMLVALVAFLVVLAAMVYTTPAAIVLVAAAPACVVVVLALRYGLDDPWLLVLVVAVLDAEGVAFGALSRFGLGFAVLAPSVGMAAMSARIHGRTWAALAVSAVVSTLAGEILWLTVSPAATELKFTSPLWSIAGIGALGVVGLALLWRSSRLQERAVEAAREAAVQSAASAAELARATELLRTVLDASPVPIQAFAPDRTVLAWNAASERLFGWSAAEVVGRPLPNMTPPDEEESGRERIRRTMAGEIIRGDRVRRLSRNGHGILIDIHAAAMHDADGKPVGIAGVLVDATERQTLEDERRAAEARERELEARLRQAAKMEAVGQLAGGVAHDFNNMLQAIRGFAELALTGLSAADSAAWEDLQHIIDTADSAKRVTQQLLTFARRNELEPRVIDPAEVLRTTAPMIGRLVGEHIVLAIETSSNAGQIRADPVQLEQAIVNLAVNARDAMPDGGRLTIRMERTEADEGFVAAHPGAAAGPYVVVRVIDTGHGMDAETREHIFEPFYTTKEVGKGIGMGLATVFGIVTMSGGVIDVVSEAGAGSAIALYFPRVPEAVRQTGAEREAPEPTGGSETILLVEDDDSVRRFARRSLEMFGYRVVEAKDGAEALALAAGYAGPLELLVSDVRMPGIQGPELAHRLAEMRSGIGVLLISGNPEADAHSELAGRHVFLEKPYSQAALANAVREALAARG